MILLASIYLCCEMLPVRTSLGSVGETKYCDSNQLFYVKDSFLNLVIERMYVLFIEVHNIFAKQKEMHEIQLQRLN